MELRAVDLEPGSFGLEAGEAAIVEHRGRRALRFEEGVRNALVQGVDLLDGAIEVDLLLSRERSFHGVVWRAAGADFESFFVRPHQVGNDDAIQYTPNPNGISSWQLYHGSGYWSPITFPIEEWFTIRVAFHGDRADVFVADLEAPVLAIGALKLPARAGGVGIQVGGPGLHVARFAWSPDGPSLIGRPAPEPPVHPGVISRWEVSDPFAESALHGAQVLPPVLLDGRRWTSVEAERTGLVNLGRVNPLTEERNTALAMAVIDAGANVTRPLELGFSDRATVFLNGQAVVPRRRDVPQPRLPLPRQHRLVGHRLPAAAGRPERAGHRRLGRLRRLGRPGTLRRRLRDVSGTIRLLRAP